MMHVNELVPQPETGLRHNHWHELGYGVDDRAILPEAELSNHHGGRPQTDSHRSHMIL